MSLGSRPRPLAPIVIDPDNAYSRAGVSPARTTEEIRRTLKEEHRRALGEANRVGGQAGLTTRLEELNALIDEIGDANHRAAYDAAHPQNELLTVQAPPGDAISDAGRRAAFVSAWLLEAHGDGVLLPHPESLPLWAPRGVSRELCEFLRRFEEVSPPQTDDEGHSARGHLTELEGTNDE